MKRTDISKTANLLVMLSAGCLVATHALGFIAPNTQEDLEIKTPTTRPTLYKSDVSGFANDGSIIQHDEQSNAIRLISGKRLLNVRVSGNTPKSFEQATVKAVAMNRAIFGVDASSVRVNEAATMVSGDDASVTLHVLRSGVRIQDASINFRFKKGSVIQIKNESFSEAVALKSKNINTAAVATKATGSRGYVGRGSAFRVTATNDGYKLVKVDEYLVPGKSQPYVVQVDTVNGEVFELRSKNLHLKGTAVAKAYPRYFGEQLADAALAFVTPTNAEPANGRGQFNTTGTEAPLLKSLAGTYVSVKNVSGRDLGSQGKQVDDEWVLKFDLKPTQVLWDNNDVAQSMVYVHTNRVIATAKQFIQPKWFDQPLRANVNHNQHCNAYWDGDSINFFTAGSSPTGKACANTGMIADVVYHEWGHGLDENTGGINDYALSEGFGDAVSMLLTEDSQVGIDFRPVEHKPVRDLKTKKVYPEDLVGEVHDDGLIVGGAWWDLFSALKKEQGVQKARELMGKYLFKGIYEFSKMTDVYDATIALDDNNADLKDGTPNLCVINKAFADHGLAKKDERCNKPLRRS